jgi:hypothetical protein
VERPDLRGDVSPDRILIYVRSRRYYRTPFRPAKDRAADLTDPGQQLHAVMAASFERRKLLSSSEYKVFKIIEDDI